MIRKRRTVIFSGFALLITAGIMFVPVKALTVMNGDQLLYAFYLSDNSFSVRWKHSVEKEAWVEYFSINDNELYLESTKFKTFGAGVPFKSEHPTVLKNGWVHMDIDRKIGQMLTIRSSDMNDYQLHYENKRYSLKPSKAAYEIGVKKTPLRLILSTQFKHIVR